MSQKLPGNIQMDIFHLDDNSNDGTFNHIKEHFTKITLLKGDGFLFWAGGMRTVWNFAIKQNKYDFYLLLNDDVELFDASIEKLISTHAGLFKQGSIIIGTTISSETGSITYGGINLLSPKKPDSYRVIPDEEMAKNCVMGNANIMLVDSSCIKAIGIFSDAYTHGIADYDYTLRASKNGINLLVAPGYLGYCEYDHGNNWLSQNTSLRQRIKYLYSPKGLAYREYCKYISEHFPSIYKKAKLKLWLKTIFPIFYDWLK